MCDASCLGTGVSYLVATFNLFNEPAFDFPIGLVLCLMGFLFVTDYRGIGTKWLRRFLIFSRNVDDQENAKEIKVLRFQYLIAIVVGVVLLAEGISSLR